MDEKLGQVPWPLSSLIKAACVSRAAATKAPGAERSTQHAASKATGPGRAGSPCRDQEISGQKCTCRKELLVPGEAWNLGSRRAEIFIITILDCYPELLLASGPVSLGLPRQWLFFPRYLLHIQERDCVIYEQNIIYSNILAAGLGT